ncbi:phosphodiester glycosidase family protein [Actinacidiphila acididurans]|uniref:Phosphodiester glycosidase family protein n=1 Tax=Actinacidiphila acididurans TaxID=2784346 RepID=A0ABS2TP33_9ACTN|nr:phosphodiester glycosidase family protein [Actinacidiphila acididurans]MBM9503738.1 phosphodiester glycosidase family protein [Actinacidiphila acididurans]
MRKSRAGAAARPAYNRTTRRGWRSLGIGVLTAAAAGTMFGGPVLAHADTGDQPSATQSWLPTTPDLWPTVVDQSRTPSIPITSGVTEHSETYDTVAGRQHAQVLHADLTNSNVRLGTVEAHDKLTDPPAEAISSMADRTGAVAGVNGDFFAINSTNRPSGMVVTDGKLIKSPNSGWTSDMWVRQDGTVGIGTETYAGTVTDGSASHAIKSVNTLDDLSSNSLVRVTPDLGAGGTIPSSTVVTGKVGTGGFVVDSVATGVKSLGALPDGTEALVGAKASATWLNTNVHVGDTLAVSEKLSPDDGVRTAISGGALLVQDGKMSVPLQAGGENNVDYPVTGLGVSKDGKHVIIATFDGRLTEGVAEGLTRPEFAQWMMKQGAYNAILFDTGGSTEMVARKPGDAHVSVMNTPSDGAERPVANGIFVYSTAPAPTEATNVVINDGTPVTTVPGATIAVPVYATDALQNPSDSTVDVQVQPSSLATWSNGELTVTGTGEGTITATSAGATTSQPLEVAKKLTSLSVSPDAPDLPNGHTQQLTLKGTADGASGTAAQVPAEAAQWSVSDPSLGSVDAHGLFTADSDNGGLEKVTATVGGAGATSTIAVGEVASTVDPMDDVADWSLRNTTGQPATLANSPGDVPPGSTAPGSMALTYTMPAGSGVRQLVLSPKNTLTVGPDAEGVDPARIGIWVKGDAKGLWFAESYVDIAGTTTTLYPTYVTFNGWQLVAADIPPGLSFPLHIGFVDFLALNTTSTYAGTVKVGGLEALYSPRPVVAPTYTAVPQNPSWLSYEENAANFSSQGDTMLLGDDAHMVASDPGSASSKVLDAAKARIPSLPAQARPDQVQMLGDMPDDGAPADLAYAKQKISEFGVPYHDVVGNHEISQGALPENGNFAAAFGDTHYSYTAGAADVIVTDNAHGGLLSSDAYQVPARSQYPWLVDQLTNAQSKAVFVVTHMPAYDPHPAANSQFGDRWEAQMYLRIVQKYQASHPDKHVIMLYGHARGFAEQILDPQGNNVPAKAGGVPQFTVADLGMPAYATSDKGGFEHFGLFHVSPSGDIQFSVEGVFTSIGVTAPQPGLTVGGHETLTATGTQIAGDNFTPPTVPIADPVSHVWSSSDPRVASVDAVTGEVTANRPGTADITVTAGGVTGKVTLTVG